MRARAGAGTIGSRRARARRRRARTRARVDVCRAGVATALLCIQMVCILKYEYETVLRMV